MIVVDIITSDMHQLHGANKVTEKLILGRNIFFQNGIKIRYVISQDGIINCDEYTESTLGTDLGTKEYNIKRKIIETLKRLSLYKSYYIQEKIVLKQFNKNSKVLDNIRKIEEKPDFIIYQDPFTAIYYLEHTQDNTPSIFISHADTDPLEQFFIGRPTLKGTSFENRLRDKYAFLFSKVNQVITICSSSKKYMKETYGLDCPCILNGIEDSEYVSEYKEGKSPIDICIVGSVNYRKGQDLAIEAVTKLKKEEQEKLRLHIVGGGSELQNIKTQVKLLGLDDIVIIHGPVLNVAKFISKMDVFILPSRADTVPIAIIEAMRAGLPVFATDVGEVSEMIKGCGYIISEKVDDIAMFYEKLIQGDYDLAEMGKAARKKYLEKYTLSKMIEGYVTVIDDCKKKIIRHMSQLNRIGVNK